VVEIDHGFGIKTVYGHCDAIHVKKGQRVERGQWIAAIGSTGRSTGPHLHYSVLVAGRAVDPKKYILD
jgi:murein DD-endopeptidase MepM/ murein hydrolase activator NlpD